MIVTPPPAAPPADENRRIFWSRKRPLQRTVYLCEVVDGATLTKQQLQHADAVIDDERRKRRRRPSCDGEGGFAESSGKESGRGDADGGPRGNGKGKGRRREDGSGGDAMEQDESGAKAAGPAAAAVSTRGEGLDSGQAEPPGGDGSAGKSESGGGGGGGDDRMEVVDADKTGDAKNGPRDSSSGGVGTGENFASPDGEALGGWDEAVRHQREQDKAQDEEDEEDVGYRGVVFRVTMMDDPETPMIDSDLERLYGRITEAADK